VHKFLFVLFLTAAISWGAGTRITFLVGSAEVHRARHSLPVRVSMNLQQGDSLLVAAQSRVELRYPDNTVLRLDENSRLVLTAAAKKPEPTLLTGKAWANVTKVGKGGQGFGLKTPTAVAAVRGTVFRMSEDDSGANVKLYEGKVDVGHPPKDGEVEGPSEVSLTQWVHLLRGEEVVCHKQGAWNSQRFDVAADLKDSWVRFNTERDKALGLPVAGEDAPKDESDNPWKK